MKKTKNWECRVHSRSQIQKKMLNNRSEVAEQLYIVYRETGVQFQQAGPTQGLNILSVVENLQFIAQGQKRVEGSGRVLHGLTYTMEAILVLLSVVVILFVASVYKSQKKNKYANLPPGPKPLPIIGNLHMIDTRKPQKSFMELSKKYGTVFSVHLGTQKFVILCGYDTIKDALINHAEEFSGRPRTAMTSKTSEGYGVIFANGENWKVMRRFTLSTLRDYGMGKKSIEDKITEECECLMETFRSYGGKPFNNLALINTAVANVIVSILLDYRYDYDDPTILKLMRLINENIKVAGSIMIRLYDSFPWLVGWLPGAHRKTIENLKELKDFVRETFTRKEKELDVNNQRNLIDAFLAKQQEGKPESTLYYHNKNLNILVINLFAAGMETTSTTLRWGLLLMMKYPEIQKKVQYEIENVIGSAQPQVEHRKEMPYTDAVIHEIQRFGDIVPGNVPHGATSDITFRGFVIPKGTTIIPLLHSALRDKSYFEKPEEFYPEHFLDLQGKFKKNEAFIPFSLGKRSCAGENLAKIELFLFFTTLLQNFTFQAPPGAELDLNSTPGLTNSPLPHEICAIPRR
ncbi:cytochrome P450 2B4-like isoform X2 [Hyla sarda]|uniref:cytochrome P450 2B4-like isoform X2 n=1 Tax=Hyla sarda TaxID=327740 RepID=UPI0024C30BCC|nr:cytochrome P450 2B4-like isoform X2 [Hyla sarda]